MHLADFSIGILGESGIVGSSVPVATGAGLASKIGGDDFVSMVFLVTVHQIKGLVTNL